MAAAERFQQLQELFHAALNLPPDERQAFLRARCLGDERLQQEIESLLAEDANPSGFLKTSRDTKGSAPLSTGARLGPFEITGAIGAGGMGDVYRARDTRLHREVAVKVLPEGFANDPERISRFRREATLLAALNHPHIAAIYGLEESNCRLALVMELVEGPTLAERIAAGPLPVEEALGIAKQIGEALEAAHEAGIIHRDLKPANVKITPDGAVKVLDFGLGKDLNADSLGDSVISPAETLFPTRAGVILGTAGYMAPEQARGSRTDRRADIWAFGVVLYEMLTSQRLFAGETISDTLAAVLTKEPDWTRVPVKARRLLRRCLEKDPKRRLQAIGDWQLLLEDVREDVPGLARTAKSRVPWAVAAAFAIIAGIGLWAPWRSKPSPQPPQPTMRLDVDLGSDVSLGSLRGADVVLSPDGTRLVYCSQSRLFTRRLDQPKATELGGTENAWAPFFSPDGQWVAFFTPEKLKKVPVQGGAAIPLCNGPFGTGGSWGEDGNIVAALGSQSGLSRIPSAGGAPTPVTELAPGEDAHRWPQILPGGRAVLFTAFTAGVGVNEAKIEVISLGDRRRKTLQRGGTYGRFLPGGHLVYIHNGTLFAVLFDVDRLEIQGTPVPVLEEVAYNGRFGSAQFDFAGSSSGPGTLLYRRGVAGAALVTVQWLDSAGKASPLLAKPGDYEKPRLSPGGNRLALVSGGDIWAYDTQREIMTRLTYGAGGDYPVWTPDERYIAFRAPGGTFWTRSDGSGKPQPLIQSKNVQYPSGFSPDGKRLAFHEISEGLISAWTVPLESDGAGLRAGKAEAFLQLSEDARSPRFSPDGRWLAYGSNVSGTRQVYVRAFPDRGGKWQISNSGGGHPIFSPSGRELFFRNLDNQIMVAAYTVNGDSFIAGKPRLWSEKRLANVGVVVNYDVAPDGKRIAALMPAEGAEEQKAQSHVIFLMNFFDELRRKVPLSGK